MGCEMPMCNKCCGIKKVVTGALLLLNAFVWPLWNDLTGWIAWIAVLMVLGGLLKFFPNRCPGCAQMCAMPAAGKGKKK